MKCNYVWKSAHLTVLLAVLSYCAFGVNEDPYVVTKKVPGAFPLFDKNRVPVLYADNTDFPGVVRALRSFASDLKMVTGLDASLVAGKNEISGLVLIAGTIGKNQVIDDLIKRNEIDAGAIVGKRESFVIQIVENPFKGVGQALIIAGSDKRGTIFGIYDLSQEIGVSPWFWWADVPVSRRKNLFVLPGTHTKGEPKVEYRGIFINDEQPALGGWVRDNFGGFKHGFYEKVFELILRMKGNFLWPAMWGQSFYTDDPLNPKLADEYGVVIGTSHHEPLMRAHVEWQREGGGPWDYNTNEKRLREFWKEGIKRMGDYESVITLAMRGDGDEPMSEESNVRLLQRIVSDQREIIRETTAKPVMEFPQVWALYKEVQDYYDKGMRVPDDVTLLLCDDNWGNIRKLPKQGEPAHPGGYGIYYHFDYVGGPRNYKWINTNPIPRVWEQMNLAYAHGARKIWIVNVGDIKPMEFPIEFFLDLAWDPEQWSHNDLDKYTALWASREFGQKHGAEIADIVSTYTRFNGRRKPELLGPDSFSPRLYSLTNYQEAERVVNEYNELASRARRIYDALPQEYRDAYYQLVLYPVEACANINDLYYSVRMNRLYASQSRASTDSLAQRARRLFEKDAELAKYYNETMSGGKWDHFMDQLRIGYKGWHDTFGANTLPELKTVSLSNGSAMGLTLEGSSTSVKNGEKPELPTFDACNRQSRYLELFNTGNLPFTYQITCDDPAVRFSESSGKVRTQKRVVVSVDWASVPNKDKIIPVRISGSSGEQFTFIVNIKRTPENAKGFLESDGYISIEAEHFARTHARGGKRWEVLPGHGRTLSAITSFPVEKTIRKIADSPYVEYDLTLKTTGEIKVNAYFSPSIDFTAGNGLEYGIALDDEEPQLMNLHHSNTQKDWEESVKNNIHIVTSTHTVRNAGSHVLRIYSLDPGVILQKIVIDTGGLRDSYLGPPESCRIR